MNILYVVIFLNRFIHSFSFLIKIKFYYDLINNLQINGGIFNDNFWYSNYYYLYDKNLGDSITINFGDRCMSQQLIFGGYINFDGYLYSTAKADLWLTPNTAVIKDTGNSTTDGYSGQVCSLLQIIQHESNCHITLQIPSTYRELQKNGYKIPPIECEKQMHFIIKEQKQSIWFWADNNDDIVLMRIKSLPYGNLYCEDTVITTVAKANCNFYYGHIPGPGQEITFEYYYSLASEPSAEYSQTCSLQLVICGTNCELSTCGIGITCSACASGYAYLEDERGQCVDPTLSMYSNYYLDSSTNSLHRCFDSCSTCEIAGDSTTHNCKTCIEGYSYIRNNGYKNCYATCAGEIILGECVSIIDFTPDSEDGGITVEVPAAEVVEELDSLVVNLNELGTDVKGDGYTLQVYQTNKEQNTTNSTTIDLSECESLLRIEHHIDASIPLLVAKMEIDRNNSVCNQIGYKIYTLDGTELDTTVCNTVKVAITYPLPESSTFNLSTVTALSSKGIDVFDSSSEFFNDICVPYATDDSLDMPLSLRRKELYQNVTLCDTGCEYEGLDTETNSVKCKCDFSSEIETEVSELDPPPFFEGVLASTNLKIAKCIKLMGKGPTYSNNYGFYLMLGILIACLGLMIYYYVYERKVFLNKLVSYTRIENDSIVSNPPHLTKKPYFYERDFFKNNFQDFNNLYVVTDIDNKQTTLDCFNVESFTLDTKKEEKEYIDDYEPFTYDESLEKDQRTFFPMFWTYILSGLELVNILCFSGEYDSIAIHISSYLLEIALDFTLNAMLFTDDVITKRYERGGGVDMMTTLLLSFISNLISSVIGMLVSKLSEFAMQLEMIKAEIKDEKVYQDLNMRMYKKIIRIRLIFYFVLQFIVLIFCFYYVTIFCTVYRGSQVNWLIDCITGIGISLAISIGISFLIALLRYLSLRCKAKRVFLCSKYVKRFQ